MALRRGRIAMVAMHTSPLARLGTGDAGGMNLVIRELAIELAAQGAEVELLTRAVGAPSTVQVAPGVILRELAAGPFGPVAKEELSSVADEFGEAVARVAGRASPRYDVIHAHYWLSGLASLPVTIELGIPLVQSFHTLAVMKNRALAPGERPEPAGRIASESFIAGQADAVVASSAAEVAVLIDDVGAPAERTWVIPPGVDTGMFAPGRATNEERLRRELGLDAGRPIIVLVGRLQPLKGHDLAVRALAEVHAMRGWAPLLVIVGEPTPGAEGFVAELNAASAEGGVATDVRFVGALDRETLADLYAAASVTLIPSHSETFGLVALESAASGTPVVAFRSAGLIESVADGESGVLLASRNPVEWAQAISRFLDTASGAGADDSRALARRHAERFSWAESAASLRAVYESL